MLEAGEHAIVLVGLLAAQVLAFALLWYWQARLRGRSRSPPDEDAEGVTCRDCGTHNAADYRYCKQCVAELPASGPTSPGSLGAPGGLNS